MQNSNQLSESSLGKIKQAFYAAQDFSIAAECDITAAKFKLISDLLASATGEITDSESKP